MEEEEQAVGSGKKGALTPWEQHSAVISIPRFDYRTPSLLLERSHSGFLITCPIKREKSATKEAISILEKISNTDTRGKTAPGLLIDTGMGVGFRNQQVLLEYLVPRRKIREYGLQFVGSFKSNVSETSEPSAADGVTKKRKLCSEETDGEHISSTEKVEDTNTLEAYEVAKEISLSSLKTDDNEERTPMLSLIKLTKSGLLLFTFPNGCCHRAVDILSSIFCSLGSGSLKPPLWCHRFFPVQETCTLKEKNLYLAVSKLVQQYITREGDKLNRPIKFAVGYNRRGADETEAKIQKTSVEQSDGLTLLDREECFKVVAKAVKDVAPDSIVNLHSPELAVLVELLPLSGVPPSSIVVGISVLPRDLITTKPRLCVKVLACDAKTTKRKG